MKKIISAVLVLSILCLSATACRSEIEDRPVSEVTTTEVTSAQEEITTSHTQETSQTETSKSMPKIDVDLYLPSDEDYGTFRTETLYLEDTPDAIINAFITHRLIPDGCSVLSMNIKDNDGVRTIELDMSESYGEAVSASGTTGETILIYCLVNTMIKAYNADEVLLTCDGDFIDTGHNVYDWGLTFYGTDNDTQNDNDEE